jgi:Kdo2-lipid IVA lauroyltransferase/acyltransferase
MDRSDPAKRRRRRKAFSREIRYRLLLPLIAFFSRLPLAWARPLGTVLGTIGWRLARRDRRRAMENLQAAFGSEKSPAEIRRICRAVFCHTMTDILEVLAVMRWPKERIRRVFPLEEAFQAVKRDMSGGVVGMTAHFGNWELLGILYSTFLPGFLAPVAKRLSNPRFQDLVGRFRSHWGLDVIYTDESPRRLLQGLKDGKLLGLLSDQDLKIPSGIFVPFFGRPAYTSTIPANLALTTGRPMWACYLVRDGRSYRVIHREIPIVNTGDRPADLLENTARWNRILEEEIRKLPEQWMWFHARWRTQPEDVPRLKRRRGLTLRHSAAPE